MITVHVEVAAAPAPDAAVHQELGAKAGVALNPATPVGALEEIAGDVDQVLVMSVNPGFGGQTFIPRSESKIRAVRALLDRPGQPRADRSGRRGRSLRTPPRIVAAGADHPRGRQRHLRDAATRSAPRASCARRATLRAAGLSAAATRRRDGRRRLASSGCGTPKPTRWGWSTTRTTSCGSRWRAPICCDRSAGAIAKWNVAGVSLPVIEAHCQYHRPRAVRRRAGSEDGRTDAVAGADGVHLRGASGARIRRWRRRAGPCTRRSDPAGRPCRLPERIRQVFA